jgi:hypothetical protein
VVPACGDEVYYVCPNGPGAGACPRGDIGSSGGGAGASDVEGDASDAEVNPPDGSDGGPACVHDVDCPPPEGLCAAARCNAGRCETVNAPSGSKVPDVPADCRATICDGAGQEAGTVVARSNVPTPAGPCLVGTCDELGRAGTAARPAGTACGAGPDGKMCDAAGSCVECNHTADCASGLYCDASHRCGSAPCTDLDCGGACSPCDLGKRCDIDADCRSYACDATTATCIQSQCLDHVQDGNETALDCGGGICMGCELGQACLVDADCISQACDATSSKCVSDPCADHRADGPESDVDCGGGCPACQVGQTCRTNGDCAPGHVCLGTRKVCQ